MGKPPPQQHPPGVRKRERDTSQRVVEYFGESVWKQVIRKRGDRLKNSTRFDVVAEGFDRVLILFEASKATRNVSFGRMCIFAKNEEHAEELSQLGVESSSNSDSEVDEDDTRNAEDKDETYLNNNVKSHGLRILKSMSIEANRKTVPSKGKCHVKQVMFSIKLKDLVRNSNNDRIRPKNGMKVVMIRSMGRDVGFVMDGSQNEVRAIIEREGSRNTNPSNITDIRLLEIFKYVKNVLKSWRAERRRQECEEDQQLTNKIDEIEIFAKIRALSSPRGKVGKSGKEDFGDRWNNNHRNRVDGLNIEEVWVTDPKRISMQVYDFFSRNLKKLISDVFKENF
ncbi:hypothetical protein L2E82_07925 [Cichorium intybus]|uniref:Uncharacterized protein n=1 Tax=Cichorium intybus TaxID=13427 RepID=A0ACB9G548_CICIN|nr:hypothetical protein L2E82_07925 [Cichorium intybus]